MAILPVERGIPIPPPGGKRAPKYPLRSMEVGESFLVTDPTMTQPRLASRLTNVGKELGRRFTQRLCDGGGIRVWRVE
jgi:hypothetical protein